MRIANCQVNHITNPLGFDLAGGPTFTWTVEDACGKRAESACITVTHAGRTVASTGWTQLSSLGAQVPGLAELLAPRTRYEWTVAVRSDAGEEAVSDGAWFETSKLGEPWQAQWLAASAQERQPVLSGRLSLCEKEVASARLYVCGLGLYQAFIDGERVGNEYLAPGTHDYNEWMQYQTYDVTGLVRNGTELAVELAPGWYAGRFGYANVEGYYGHDLRFIAELRVSYADGSEQVAGSGEGWQVTRSNVTFSGIYDGERRDDTLPDVPAEPAALLDVDEAAALTARLCARLSLPVTAHETFAPSVIETPAGECVLDLGQNIAGVFRMRVHEPAGTQLRLQFGELLQDSCFYRDNLRSARAEYAYVSDGRPHVLEPGFTYYGYRYVKVEVNGEPPVAFDPASFTGVALYSDLETQAGSIKTGNSLVNRLVSNVRWGMRDNFVDTPTDCPQRDERMGWTGDACVFAPTAFRLASPYAFFRKYLHDMACEQRALGGRVPGVVPSFGLGPTAAVWGDATTLIAWEAYRATGDAAILREHLPAMRTWVDWVAEQDGDAHAWGECFQYGDWLALDGRKTNDRLGATDEGLIAQLYFWLSTRVVAQAAEALGEAEVAQEYQRRAEELHAWTLAEYYSANGRCTVNTQTAYALSLVHGLGSREHNAGQLKRLIEENGGHLSTGFVGTPILLPALSEGGLAKEAYDQLLNEGYPGWLFAVRRGATTVWERWDSLDASGRITGIDMNSMNHYAYGSVAEWLFSHAAGLTAVKPGYARARIAPEVSWRLGSLCCSYASAAGTWKVSWEVLGERELHVAVTVPFGAVAEVELPFATEEAYAELGGRELTAGSYEVTYRTAGPLRWVPCVSWTVRELCATRATELVLRGFAKHPEFLAPADRDRPVREVADKLGLTEERLAELDAALRALAE